MAYFNVPNFCQIVVQTLHASPTTIVLRDTLPPYHSHHRFPAVGDVRLGTVYGPGQYEQQSYLTGTMSGGGGGGGTRIYPTIS